MKQRGQRNHRDGRSSKRSRNMIHHQDHDFNHVEQQLQQPIQNHGVIVHLEVFLCVYLMVHSLLQFYNIFKTNFYQYDVYMVMLCLLVPLLHMLIKSAAFQDRLPVFEEQQNVLFQWLYKYFRRPPVKPGKHYMKPKSVGNDIHALLARLLAADQSKNASSLAAAAAEPAEPGESSGSESSGSDTNSGNSSSRMESERSAVGKRRKKLSDGSSGSASQPSPSKPLVPSSSLDSSSISAASSSSSSSWLEEAFEKNFWNLEKLLVFLKFKWNVLLLYVLSFIVLAVILVVLRLTFEVHGVKPVFLTILPVLLYFCATGGLELFDHLIHKIPSGDETSLHDSTYVRQAYIIRGRQSIKTFLYSVCGPSFYATVLPLALIPETTFYSQFRCVLLCIFVGINCSIMNYLQFLHVYFLRTLYHIKVVGCWRKIGSLSQMDSAMSIEASGASDPIQPAVNNSPRAKIALWSRSKLPYTKGSVVSYKGDVYEALGDQNTGYPGKSTDLLLFSLFHRPERTHIFVIYVQGAVTLVQLLMLQMWSLWDVAAIALLFNYYILWNLVTLWLQHRRIMAGLFHGPTSLSASRAASRLAA